MRRPGPDEGGAVSGHPTAYVRLHGLNESEYDYDYDYFEEDLEELGKKLEVLNSEHDRVYCMFNNYEMFDNAKTLRDML